jgi:hypothetical protein
VRQYNSLPTALSPITIAVLHPRPAAASEWIASAVSPAHWQQLRRRRQLQHQYLKELFHSDVQMNALETDSLRRMGQVGAGRRPRGVEGGSRARGAA